MKRLLLAICLLGFLSVFGLGIGSSLAAPPPSSCTTIKDGGLVDSAGNALTLGYDQWGYNYQAHMFNGFYENYSRPQAPVTESDTTLQMKWNDAWLGNKDCDGDGKLDRHYGYPKYVGSGAWLTNHQWGTYEAVADGRTYKWTYFVKIVAAPADAVLGGGIWRTADGVEIGPAIWGEFAIIQEVYNDQGTGEHGLLYKSPASPGFGAYKP